MADEVSVQALLDARRLERERLARILHDDIAGGLTAAGLSLDLLAMDVPPELVHRVREIQDVLESGFAHLRELSMEFHPDPATRFQLLPALEALVRRCQRRFAGKLGAALPEDIAGALTTDATRACYAIAEAALLNVLQHSRADNAWLVLNLLGPRAFSLTVRDDGDGFAKGSIKSGTGLAVIHHQAAVAGLTVLIESGSGMGTRVHVGPATVAGKKRRANRGPIDPPAFAG